jgi:hypothetical protein
METNKLYIEEGLLFINGLILAQNSFTVEFSETNNFVFFKTSIGEILTRFLKITELAKNKQATEFFANKTELLNFIEPFININ